MEQVDLKQYGFIQSVNLCITLLEEFGSKLTPEQLDKYLGEQTKIYMSSQEFLALVVDAVEKGGGAFFEKMNELYGIREEILKVIDPENLIPLIEGEAQKVCESLVVEEAYIKKLADFCLASPRFRDYMYAYTKQAVALEIKKMDLGAVVTEIVSENADKYAELLLFSTKQKQLMAEASLFNIQSIEKLVYSMYSGVIFDPDYLHPQGQEKQGGVNE